MFGTAYFIIEFNILLRFLLSIRCLLDNFEPPCAEVADELDGHAQARRTCSDNKNVSVDRHGVDVYINFRNLGKVGS